MMILGVVLLIVGLVLHIWVIWIVGLILLAVGAIWWALSVGARPRLHSRYRYW